MSMSAPLGPLVLAGSGEYTPTMEIVDRYLLQVIAGRPVVLIATSCAPEGDDVMDRWEQMGAAHFRNLGVEATPVRIRDQVEANIAAHAEAIASAGLVWFSGGRATYLAEAFDDTLCWRALEAANRRGTAVAGSSGGLGVLNAHMPDPTAAGPQPANGLGLAAPLRAMPHFDRMELRRPEFVERVITNLQPGQRAVGVDEDTAIVWHENEWRVMGHKRAVVFGPASESSVFMPGDRIDVRPPPLRSEVTSYKQRVTSRRASWLPILLPVTSYLLLDHDPPA